MQCGSPRSLRRHPTEHDESVMLLARPVSQEQGDGEGLLSSIFYPSVWLPLADMTSGTGAEPPPVPAVTTGDPH